jgi:hypothetical protein
MTPRPPAALLHLFPEFPAWALAPFLGEMFAPVPESYVPSDGMNVILSSTSHAEAASDVPDPTGSRWLVSIQTAWIIGSGRSLRAQLWCDDRPADLPFGARLSHLLLPEGVFPLSAPNTRPRHSPELAATRWEPRPITSRVGATERAHRDLLRRWQAITDPQVQHEIAGFWLGHDLPILADLGLATLQLASAQPAPRSQRHT